MVNFKQFVFCNPMPMTVVGQFVYQLLIHLMRTQVAYSETLPNIERIDS
jgi:hypothetical protein